MTPLLPKCMALAPVPVDSDLCSEAPTCTWPKAVSGSVPCCAVLPSGAAELGQRPALPEDLPAGSLLQNLGLSSRL
jgi:hypothetical protein